MEFQEFKNFVQNSVAIIIADLDKLRDVAEEANKSIADSSTLTLQTTRRPDDLDLKYELDISRCTIPIAMVCVSVIDMIGQWLKERPDNDFGSSAQIFLKKLSGKDDLNKLGVQEKFKKNFRHGIMHSFFAKQGFGVSYPAFEGISLFTDDFGSTLDVKYLMTNVLYGLNKFIAELDNPESEIAKTAFWGYKKWMKSTD